MTKYTTEKYYSNHKFQNNAGSFSNVLTRAVSNYYFVNHLLKIVIIYIYILIKISEQ